MTATELLSDLKQQGFTLIPLAGGKLGVKPADRLTEELRQHLRERKGELLALLRAQPYLNERQELIIPFVADPKYHWWKAGGMSLAAILTELNASPDVWKRYVIGYVETRQ